MKGTDVKVTEQDILSVWSGIRPLVQDPTHMDGGTSNLVRNHLLHVSPSDLLTISGGKWTTFRRMAQDTVDRAIELFHLVPSTHRTSVTEDVRLIGSARYTPELVFKVMHAAQQAVSLETAQHLVESYGDRSLIVLEMALRQRDLLEKVHERHPYLMAEVVHAVRNEWARSAVDFLARRTRMAFVDTQAAKESIERVVQTMGDVAGWDFRRRAAETRRCQEWLSKNMTVGRAAPISGGLGASGEADQTLWGGVVKN